MKHLPGPLPSSCLTCRQRRKKCDRGHPACARCTVGGFKCLGYEHITSSTGSSNHGAASSQPGTALALPSISYRPKKALQRTRVAYTLESESRRSIALLDEPPSTATRAWVDHNDVESEASNVSASHVTLDPGYSPPYQISPQPRGGSQNPHTEGTQSRSNESVPILSVALGALGLPSSNLPPPRYSTSQGLVVLSPNSSRQPEGSLSSNAANHITLPPTFYPDPVISGSTIKFILSLYEPLFEILAFFSKHIRGRLLTRIQTSSLTHWSMYLGAKVLRTVLQGGEEKDLRAYDPWFERLDKLCIMSSNDNFLEDLAGRLSSALELSYLKFITSNVNAGYTLLKNIAPTFMTVAFADPSVWPRHANSSGISLTHTFLSNNLELARFVFMDALSSFAFGVPPLVEYDTSSPATTIDRGQLHPIEWVHGCAATFTVSIIKINIWRAQGDNAPIKHTWEEIEADILGWSPKPDAGPPGNSRRTVARLAIQEGWRHANLIYLYMGMCGVTSHDPRVQSSVRQIMNMLDVMQFDDPVCIHFFFPCLVAGICVRSEKQRALIRKSITQSKKNTAWLFRGTDVVAVLDHLWHRGAANGGAVTWEDYIRSRRANIRVDS